ncbi:MAG: hypothetical protein NNA30_11500 [Nitrospira sp.]|nr:hypothetical protein [Nitrospira sp.]
MSESLKAAIDRLRADVQYLMDLSYIARGGDVTLRGPSLTALLNSLRETLAFLQSLETEEESLSAVMARINERMARSQSVLSEQAARAAEADRSLNRAMSDPTKGEAA